jgi:hypothetical protein
MRHEVVTRIVLFVAVVLAVGCLLFSLAVKT